MANDPSKTSGDAIDYSNPFYLHHSDNPGMMLVSQLLTGDNYPLWQRSMSTALDAKNKFGFVNGTIAKPAEEDTKYVS